MRLVVTGTTSGIGEALARRLVSRGNQVWGVARTADRLALLRHQLGANFSFTVADLADPTAPATVSSALDAAGFAPEAVVLNAGIYPHDCEGDFDFAVAAGVLQTNLTGALALVAAFLPGFLRQGRGQFVAVSSIFALRPDPLGVSYAASKAGLTMAFRGLAQRYRKSAVRFSVILLGPIATGRNHPRRSPSLLRIVQSADHAAAAIVHRLEHPRPVSFYPRSVGLALRVASWLPDSLFTALTQPFRR